MKILHKIGKKQVSGTDGDAAFLLSNKKGDYLSLGSDSRHNKSYFQGLFFFKDWTMFKTVENIYLDEDFDQLINNFSNVQRKKNAQTESFWMTGSSMIYEVDSYEGYVNIDLDCRFIYDFDDHGRIYDIYEEDGCIIVEYTKFEDDTLSGQAYKVFLAIKGVDKFEKVARWVQKQYTFDLARGTRSEFYVYNALRIPIKGALSLVFSFSEDKKGAIEKAKMSFENAYYLKRALINYHSTLLNKETLMFNSAVNALDSLIVSFFEKGSKYVGIFAGLPWFFQFWSRDELISLRAIILEEKFDLVKKILFRYLNSILPDGRIPNRYPSSQLGSADGIGWLVKRLDDLIKLLEQKKVLDNYFSKEDLLFVQEKLSLSLNRLHENYAKENMVFNKAQETWMDTPFGGDTRQGFSIEIQALQLVFYRFMKKLCNMTKHDAAERYAEMEKNLRKTVKATFFKNDVLEDCHKQELDIKIRSNMFLAYYIYPELLSKKEWKLSFDKGIKALWLDWGGLSTIDKSHHLFCSDYISNNDQSYHRGDSWFWVNHLAAISMLMLDRDRYGKYAEKIRDATIHEMMFSGEIACLSELSSASKLRSKGCFNQAWSAATFIELMYELGV